MGHMGWGKYSMGSLFGSDKYPMGPRRFSMGYYKYYTGSRGISHEAYVPPWSPMVTPMGSPTGSREVVMDHETACDI